MSAIHNSFIERLINSGNEKIIRRYRKIVAKNKKGVIFPINLFVNYFWKINDDFSFSGLFVKIIKHSYFLVTNEFGIIEDSEENQKCT